MLKNGLEIRKSKQSDILPIAFNMRVADAKEVYDSHLYSPYKALTKGMNSSGDSWTIVIDGVPIGMVGVSNRTLITKVGTPWLLGTDSLLNDKKLFLRVSRVVLKNISEGYKLLENYVSVENKSAIRWIEYLGFTFGEEIRSITGVTFKRFFLEIE